jgi:hypothetical protein
MTMTILVTMTVRTMTMMIKEEMTMAATLQTMVTPVMMTTMVMTLES